MSGKDDTDNSITGTGDCDNLLNIQGSMLIARSKPYAKCSATAFAYRKQYGQLQLRPSQHPEHA